MLSKLRSRNLTPKPAKVPLWKKLRKPLNRKRSFKAQDNANKIYHSKRSPEEVSKYAQQKRQERLANPTEAEKAFAAIMDELGIGYEREKIIYYAEGRKFIISDFFLRRTATIIEIDGNIHERQAKYDISRDRYFGYLGYKTIRYSNKEVLKNSENVREKVRREVDGNES